MNDGEMDACILADHSPQRERFAKLKGQIESFNSWLTQSVAQVRCENNIQTNYSSRFRDGFRSRAESKWYSEKIGFANFCSPTTLVQVQSHDNLGSSLHG